MAAGRKPDYVPHPWKAWDYMSLGWMVMMTRALFLSLQDNGPDEAPPGVWTSWAGWDFPGMPNLLDILRSKIFHGVKGGGGRQEVPRDTKDTSCSGVWAREAHRVRVPHPP